MKTLFLKRALVGALVLVAGLPGLLQADIYLKYKQHTDSFEMMGKPQPARDNVRETWLTKDMVRSDDGIQTVILRLDRKVAYFIDPQSKTYSEIPLDIGEMTSKAIEDQQEMDDADKAQAKQMLQGMMKGMGQFSITVKETGEKKKIGSWNCTKYLQTTTMAMGPSESEIWATSDIRLDYALLNRTMLASMMMMPGARDGMAEATKELGKIKGVNVYTVSTAKMMNTQVKTTQELLDYAEKKAPGDFYDPPAGYAKQAM